MVVSGGKYPNRPPGKYRRYQRYQSCTPEEYEKIIEEAEAEIRRLQEKILAIKKVLRK